MAKSKKAKSYEELKKIWYTKLKKSGFEDAESDENHLKTWSSNKFAAKALVQNGGWQAKAAYYQMAERFLAEFKFETRLERQIWEYHTNAISIRDIAETLNKTKVINTNRQAVWLVIRRLEDIMKSLYLVGYKADE